MDVNFMNYFKFMYYVPDDTNMLLIRYNKVFAITGSAIGRTKIKYDDFLPDEWMIWDNNNVFNSPQKLTEETKEKLEMNYFWKNANGEMYKMNQYFSGSYDFYVCLYKKELLDLIKNHHKLNFMSLKSLINFKVSKNAFYVNFSRKNPEYFSLKIIDFNAKNYTNEMDVNINLFILDKVLKLNFIRYDIICLKFKKDSPINLILKKENGGTPLKLKWAFKNFK